MTGEIIVPRGTLNRTTEKERKRCKDETHRAIYGDVESEPKNESALLTTENDWDFIQRIIKTRDKKRNSMSQAEVSFDSLVFLFDSTHLIFDLIRLTFFCYLIRLNCFRFD